MPRILAIDYGQKRTGIAVTDELQIIASGLTTIPSATTINFLKEYFSKENVEKASARLHQFSWDKTYQDHIKIYESTQ